VARQQAQPAQRVGSFGARISNSGAGFEATPDEPLLDAARKASLNFPHSCKGGNCGACKARLLRGEIHYPHGTPLGLSAAEMDEGLILLCQARARSDLTLETLELHPADRPVARRLPCRIERVEHWSQDVVGLFLRLPAAEEFSFAPGQYIDILLPGGRRRSFSIASPPDVRPLELHVRRVAGGAFTDGLFRGDAQGELLQIEAPLGQFVYRPHERPHEQPDEQPDEPKAPPMLLIGGGTGIAPLLSILRHVVERGIERDMQLFWGVRSEVDLYAQATLETLILQAASRGACTYTPVLSEASSAWRGLTGFVHAAALAGIDDLASHEVYAAGPPQMIAAIKDEYAARAVSMSRLYFDSFDYAPDTLERQRTSASTKS
jgi:CDP-4-dehydro-6-deoxyglucose reductase, E3